MQQRKIGSLDVTVVGLGCNNFGTRLDERETALVVDACLQQGINFFDTADIYGAGLSEEYLGRALGSRRSEVVVATKFGMDFRGDPPGSGGSEAWVRVAAEHSLKRLGTDYIDLYQFHTPDPDTPYEETLGALNELVESGKVLEIGCSNFEVPQIRESSEVAERGGYAPWVSVQNRYSLLHREPEEGVLEACRARGLAFLPYFPLQLGMLTGKYLPGLPLPEGTRLAAMAADRRDRYFSEEGLDAVGRLADFCSERGHTLLELSFSWLLAHEPVVSVIAGASNPEQVRANAAAPAWALTADDLDQVDAVLGGTG